MTATKREGNEKAKTKSALAAHKSNAAESLPSISRDKSRKFKIYRAPPTPPLEVQTAREKRFVLDCNAVSNISLDYSHANPKLGSVIPPYNALEDKATRNYFESYGVSETLEKTNIVRFNNF
jgi:hypothetical protein